MAFILDSTATASLNIQMTDTNANKVSRTFSGILPFSDLTWGIGAPSGATNATEASNVAELLDDAARALCNLSKNSYSNAKYTLTQSLMDIIQG